VAVAAAVDELGWIAGPWCCYRSCLLRLVGCAVMGRNQDARIVGFGGSRRLGEAECFVVLVGKSIEVGLMFLGVGT
jgi:hypothetical protein